MSKSIATDEVAKTIVQELNRLDILGANDLTIEDVKIPEWGDCTVRVKTLTGAERDAFEDFITDRNGKKSKITTQDARARLVARTVVDEQSNLIFTPDKYEMRRGKRAYVPGDIPALTKKSAAALDRIFSVAMRLCGMKQEDIEEMTENFTAGQSEDSTLD